MTIVYLAVLAKVTLVLHAAIIEMERREVRKAGEWKKRYRSRLAPLAGDKTDYWNR
mgnify:CR=1 FL=1